MATASVAVESLRSRPWACIALLGSALLSFELRLVSASAAPLVGAFVVNLDADRDRWSGIAQQLSESTLIQQAPLRFSRIRGVAAPDMNLHLLVVEGKLTLDAYNDIVEQDSIVSGERLTLGALGCLESHVLAWRRVVEIGAPALILEDDVTFSVDFDAGLAAALSHLPSDFGLLYLANVIGDVITPNLLPFDVRMTTWVGAWW